MSLNSCLAEIFLSSTRTSSQSDVMAHDLGVLVSLCLQHNCPAETIAHALARNPNGSASGVIGAVLDHFTLEMDHLSECVMQNKEPLTPGEEGLRDLKIMMAIYLAAKTGKTIRL